MNNLLRLHLLGGLQIEYAGAPLTGLVTRKAEILLAYLALQRRPHGRETLASLLWDDRSQKQALANLRTLLASLRRHLAPLVDARPETISLHPEAPVWVDALELERRLAGAADDAAGAASLQAAAALYRGDFLEGVLVRDSRGLEEWIALRRELLRGQAAEIRQRLALLGLARRDYAAGIGHARALIALDPLHEAAHRLLMRLLARAGQPNAALAHFSSCRQILHDELGVEPAAETSDLYERIRHARLPAPHALPAPPTPFVGRAEALAAISRQLDEPACRLLTLTGPGGVGKTRLALQAADERRGDYLHGIYFVPLAAVESAGGLPFALADALGLQFQGAEKPLAQVLAYLEAREVLLVLDNYEHLLPAGADFARQLLEAAPALRLLATSRERLKLQAEWLMPVVGLAYPPADDPAAQADPAGFESVQLFVASARRAQPSLGLAAAGGAGAAICRLVEGMPLGIELAAASLTSHPPERVAREIQANLDFLHSQAYDVPDRHRSLRAVFEHAWALLAAPERDILARLSIFHGDFDAQAALEAAQAGSAALARLVDQSLLRPAGAGRFGLHQVLRQYAGEKLAASGQQAETARRHTAYFAGWLAGQARQLRGARQKAALQAVRTDFDNLQQAWAAALAEPAPALDLANMAAGMFECLRLDGRLHAGADLFGQARQQLAPDDALLAARLANYHGWFLTGLSDHEQAAAAIEGALAYFEQARLPNETAEALLNLGEVRRLQGGYAEATALFERARALAEAGRANPANQALAWHSLGNVALRQGALSLAAERYTRALALRREQQDLIAACPTLNNLGLAHYRLGNVDEARACLEEALKIDNDFDLNLFRAPALSNLGLVHEVTGGFAASLEYNRRSLALVLGRGPRYYAANFEYNVGWNLFCLGDYDTARQTLEENLRYARRYELAAQEGQALSGLGLTALAQGHLDEAGQHLQAGHDIRAGLGDRRAVAWSLHHLGRLALTAGDLPAALARLEQALAMQREVSDRWGTLSTLALLGRVYGPAGQPEQARAALREAVEGALPHNGRGTLAEAALGAAWLCRADGQLTEAAALLALVRDFEWCQAFVRAAAAAALDEWALPPAGASAGEPLEVAVARAAGVSA